MKLSVIICTHNRSYAILDCLESIKSSIQAAGLDAAEIVVVDNNSRDHTGALVAEWARASEIKAMGIAVRVVVENKPGLAAARNCGVQASSGMLLAFTDDDCRVSQSYVSDLLRYDGEDGPDNEPVLRGGRIDLGDPDDLKLTIKTGAERVRWSRAQNSARYYNLGNSLLGANMAMRRTVINLVGRFDETLGAGAPIPAGEDTDYILRAYIAGVTIEYVPDMAVTHYHGRKADMEAKDLLRAYSKGTGALYAKHLFTHPLGCLQLYWDAKGAAYDVVFGKRDHEFGFSRAEKLYYCAIGAGQYVLVVCARLFGGYSALMKNL